MDEPAAAAAEPAPQAAPVRGLAVLVVDDDPLVLANTAAMLEDLGHTALQAASGAEALGFLRGAHAVDVVLTDQVMPKMTGAQLIAAVRAEWPQLPLIIATGFAELPADLDPDLPKLKKLFQQALLARTIEASLQRAANNQKIVASPPTARLMRRARFAAFSPGTASPARWRRCGLSPMRCAVKPFGKSGGTPGRRR